MGTISVYLFIGRRDESGVEKIMCVRQRVEMDKRGMEVGLQQCMELIDKRKKKWVLLTREETGTLNSFHFL